MPQFGFYGMRRFVVSVLEKRIGPGPGWASGADSEVQIVQLGEPNVHALCDNVRKQRVQIWTRLYSPSIITRLRWMFGRNMRLLAFLERLTLCPNIGPLPQISHFAIVHLSTLMTNE